MQQHSLHLHVAVEAVCVVLVIRATWGHKCHVTLVDIIAHGRSKAS